MTHSVVDAKTRLVALRTAEEASIRLLKDIKSFSRKCANDRLGQAIKTCLSYDPNVTYPDGTIATYHLNENYPRLLLAQNMPSPSRGPRSEPQLSILPQSAVGRPVCVPPCALQQCYVPVDVFAHPWTLFTSPSFSVSQPGTSASLDQHHGPVVGTNNEVNNSGDLTLPGDNIVLGQQGEVSTNKFPSSTRGVAIGGM
ncbi:hypothetical protein DL96DRAFT_1289852 [Flagelloscypha sp. PMI_526]|nr:hypothetical protein DL96DRAFT_1289852 [Flagelloscypha sp. PMI_526]